MSSFVTKSYKTVICPTWNEKIRLCGEYLLSKEKGHTYEGKFLGATCPVIENLKLPPRKRDPKYKYFPFCNHQPCELLDEFKPIIDIRQGYSQ